MTYKELPIQAKLEMAKDISRIIAHLHRGEKKEADFLIEELKKRSVYFSEEAQQAVLMFSEQVDFQYDYDPWHKVTDNVEKAARQVLEALGLTPP